MKYKMTTESGLNFYHVSSAFQKFIRRGMEHEALWMGTELYLSGFEEYCWYRLRVIVSEDVGLANPDLSSQVNSLYQTYKDLKKKKNKSAPQNLPFIHALLLVIRSPKSRIVDNLLCEYMFLRKSVEQPEFPDYVFDCHTSEGRKLGRGNEHFYEESGKITNEPEWLEKEEYEVRDRVKQKYIQQELNIPFSSIEDEFL